jgi:hypothetical protein
MDPITLLATASAIWSGIKKASEFASEAEGIFAQLSKYCGVADQREQHITEAKNKPKKPRLFGKLEFSNDTAEAFNAFEAEYKLQQMEAEIRETFLYGAWADLPGGFGSMDGYRKFCDMRRKIRAERIRMKQEQEDMQKEFWDNLILWIGGGTVIIIGAIVIYATIMAIINRGV